MTNITWIIIRAYSFINKFQVIPPEQNMWNQHYVHRKSQAQHHKISTHNSTLKQNTRPTLPCLSQANLQRVFALPKSFVLGKPEIVLRTFWGITLQILIVPSQLELAWNPRRMSPRHVRQRNKKNLLVEYRGECYVRAGLAIVQGRSTRP